MYKGGLILRRYEATVLEERLEKISFHGSAINGLCRVLEVIDTIKEFDPCPKCRQEHDQLTTNAIAWSIRRAINALAYDLGVEGERMTEIVEKGRIPDERRHAHSPK